MSHSYNYLASYYDLLVGDAQAISLWVDFVKQHFSKGSILEVACGTGEITQALYSVGYDIVGTDISKTMIEEAKRKYPHLELFTMDMVDFSITETYEAIICFCDSLNYLASLEEVSSFFKEAYKHLTTNGVLMFDMHSKERITEFKEPFIEEGYLDEIAYQWTIISNDNELHHHFAFWGDDDLKEEYHLQTVFSLVDISNILKTLGFKCQVYTDFTQLGVSEGERYCIVAQKEAL